jgi:hypothetical protein
MFSKELRATGPNFATLQDLNKYEQLSPELRRIKAKRTNPKLSKITKQKKKFSLSKSQQSIKEKAKDDNKRRCLNM